MMNLKTLLRNLFSGPYLAVAIAGLVLAVFIVLLVGRNYLAETELQASVLRNFQQDLDRQATNLSYFSAERKNDLKNLPTNREIAIFFENKSLGMSMEYGLRASLNAIHESLDLILKGRRLGTDPIYSRFVFVDSAGECLIDTQRPSGSLPQGARWQGFLAPGSSGPVILTERRNGATQLMVSSPYFFKGTYSGQIVAWLSTATIHKHLIHSSSQFSEEIVKVFPSQGDSYFPTDSEDPAFAAILPDVAGMKDREFRLFKVADRDGGQVKMVVTLLPIKETPLFLLGAIPASELFGHISPWHLLVALISLSILSLLGVGIVWRANTRTLILHTRLEEAANREQEIGEKNRQLEEEIAERKQVEEALRESEQKYRYLVSNMPAVAFKGHGDWSIEFFDDKIEELTGYKNEDFNSGRMKWSDIIVREDLQGAKDAFKESLKTNKAYIREYRVRHKNGETLWIQARGQIICDNNGNIDFVSGVFFDITERKKFEEDRLMLGKLESLGLLAGGIAHDFNNILTAILGNISLAAIDIPPEERGHERLLRAERACVQAQTLARQLLTFAKGGTPVKERISVAGTIAESAEFACRGSQVRCEFTLPGDLWPLEVDPGQISQVFQNLIINAIQAMPAGGTIKVQAQNFSLKDMGDIPLQAGNYVKIAIQDQGRGIRPQHIAKIFDPYFTTKKTGSGLGLATSYSIIKNHNGHVAVESKMGKGTTFHIYLPASDEGGVRQPVEDRKLFTGKGKVLVMDDEEIVREVLGKMLTNLGYEAKLTRDGAEAIKIFSEAQENGDNFDAVILDLTVPGGMGGKESIVDLLKIDPHLKAIVSSGYSDDRIMADFKKYGFSGVIAKPYRVSELSKILHKVIENKM